MQEEYRPKLKPGAQKLLWLFEGSVLVCMAVVIISGILSMYSAQKEFEAFDGNCIYISNLSFVSKVESTTIVPTTETAPTLPERVRRAEPATDETPTNSSIESTVQTKEAGRKFRMKKLKHIFKSFDSSYADEGDDIDEEIEPVVARNVDVSRKQVRTEADLIFLSTMQVDVIKTIWVSSGFCDYVLYNQVLSTIVGMVCTTMLVLYNTAGKAQLDWGIPKPWRIVFPAAIVFGIMTIASLVYLIITNNGYTDFCGGLSNNLETKTLSCRVLINAFQPVVNSTWIAAGDYYMMHIVNIRLTLAAWLIAFVIMLARMFFVIDFRLVHVTISRLPQKRNSPPVEASTSGLVNVENEVKHATKMLDAKKDRSTSSREDMDEYQSAHSDLDATGSEPTSLQPLFPGQAQSKE